MGYTTDVVQNITGGDPRRRRGAVIWAYWRGWSPGGSFSFLRRCAPSPTGPGTAGPSATGAWRSRRSGAWNIIRTRPATSSSSRRRPPAMRRRSPSSSRAIWTWSARRSPAAARTWRRRGWTSMWRTASSGRRAPPWAATTASPWPWPWRRWTTISCPIPGWRRCSPRRRRSACWERRRWTSRPSGAGSSSTWTLRRRGSSPSAAPAAAWPDASCR